MINQVRLQNKIAAVSKRGINSNFSANYQQSGMY